MTQSWWGEVAPQRCWDLISTIGEIDWVNKVMVFFNQIKRCVPLIALIMATNTVAHSPTLSD